MELGLIALLCQSCHLPVFDWLLTSFKYLVQSKNIFSVSTQVYQSIQCEATAGVLKLFPFRIDFLNVVRVELIFV